MPWSFHVDSLRYNCPSPLTLPAVPARGGLLRPTKGAAGRHALISLPLTPLTPTYTSRRYDITNYYALHRVCSNFSITAHTHTRREALVEGKRQRARHTRDAAPQAEAAGDRACQSTSSSPSRCREHDYLISRSLQTPVQDARPLLRPTNRQSSAPTTLTRVLTSGHLSAPSTPPNLLGWLPGLTQSPAESAPCTPAFPSIAAAQPPVQALEDPREGLPPAEAPPTDVTQPFQLCAAALPYDPPAYVREALATTQEHTPPDQHHAYQQPAYAQHPTFASQVGQGPAYPDPDPDLDQGHAYLLSLASIYTISAAAFSSGYYAALVQRGYHPSSLVPPELWGHPDPHPGQHGWQPPAYPQDYYAYQRATQHTPFPNKEVTGYGASTGADAPMFSPWVATDQIPPLILDALPAGWDARASNEMGSAPVPALSGDVVSKGGSLVEAQDEPR